VVQRRAARSGSRSCQHPGVVDRLRVRARRVQPHGPRGVQRRRRWRRRGRSARAFADERRYGNGAGGWVNGLAAARISDEGASGCAGLDELLQQTGRIITQRLLKLGNGLEQAIASRGRFPLFNPSPIPMSSPLRAGSICVHLHTLFRRHTRLRSRDRNQTIRTESDPYQVGGLSSLALREMSAIE
jgi:hypothetical protein